MLTLLCQGWIKPGSGLPLGFNHSFPLPIQSLIYSQ
jgi:hypothetical protein